MAKKNKLRELSDLQDDFLTKREDLLSKKVDGLALTLFDKVYKNYLINLEKENGIILNNKKNIDIVKGLDAIYKSFLKIENSKVVKDLVIDLTKIVDNNEKYFDALTNKNKSLNTKKVKEVISKRLGLEKNGKPIKNGFVDKFLKDETLIKKIKKQTLKAITNGNGFEDFRKELKVSIQGSPEVKQSGGLQQYYRNYAYDTLIKVDRATAEEYAKDLGLRYFFYTGGIIDTTRPFCDKCNGMIIDSNEFKKLSYEEIKPSLRSGLPDGNNETWNPLEDLGGYGCRHRKRFVLDSVAELSKSKILDINILKS